MQYKATLTKGNHFKLIRFFAVFCLILSIISSVLLLLAAFISGIALAFDDSFIWLPILWFGGAILALGDLYAGFFVRSILCAYADATENIYILTSIAAAEYNENHAAQVTNSSSTTSATPNTIAGNSNTDDELIDPFA